MNFFAFGSSLSPPPETTKVTVEAKKTAVDAETPAEIASIVSDVVNEVVSTVPNRGEVTPAASAAPERPPRPTSVGKRKRRTPEPSKTPRRGVLQEDSDEEEEASDEDANDDPNLMPRGADQCTGLNSDEDPDLREEPEEEEDGGGTDSWDGDWNIGALTYDKFDVEFADLPASVWSSAVKDKELISSMRHDGWEYDSTKFGSDPTYADLSEEAFGPSDSVLSVAEDPLALWFYFLPPNLWSQTAVESNPYHTQSVSLRASQQRRSGGEIEDIGEIRRRLACVADIEAWVVLRVVALLVTRMLAPIRKGIVAHWSTKKVGALPANRFGLFMAKNRFFHIISPTTSLFKRGWTESGRFRTFARGYKPPPIISFDEATLPSRSRYNPTRQFNKDKPHRWGTKVFVAACAKSAYLYCGAKTHLQTPVPKDNNSGEAAVLRNMDALLPPHPKSPWRLVVTDLFYTSVKLALELLHRRICLTDQGVVTSKKYKTVNKRKVMVPPQGIIKLTENKRFPTITAAMWMDRNPVHMLSSGGSQKEIQAKRRINGEVRFLPAPSLVGDYHRSMGGVDVHDQRRMQRYSVQLAYKSRKYYKTMFHCWIWPL
ncbi:hypothetical protein PHMEG_00024282 [Phytophthora megakarya]|uniref:PiggyBac transposable element-derived protein domain-containing protein n=1 Tax=Phytophthora megakarya TaxID=4795 RepID=A0A225VGA9_9STRA|nr:hypothetical protein PHMEG_00024282 [Phytophthora megakarya]